ncbi:hypothetical protein BRARA_I01194, partial [Brassica rapa]
VLLKLIDIHYSNEWNKILRFMLDGSRNKTVIFLIRSVFQTNIHYLWRERNGRRHGEQRVPSARLQMAIDKQIRNQISSSRINGSTRYAKAMEVWIATR